MWIATGVNAENGKIPWGSNRLEIQGGGKPQKYGFPKNGGYNFSFLEKHVLVHHFLLYL